MRIKVSNEALTKAGGSHAVALQRAGVDLRGVTVTKDGDVLVKARRANPARGRAGGSMRPKKGKGAYNRAQAKAVRS